MPLPSDTAVARRAGRPPDASRDADIRAVVLELLGEQGYDKLTIEAVAVRARAGKGTIYRRWPSKVELVIDAINDLKPTDVELPDTGTLPDDIRQLFEETAVAGPATSFPLIAGLAPALIHDKELAAAFQQHFVAPRVARVQVLLDRAADRGEIPPSRNADLVCAAFPAFMLQRVVFGGDPPDVTFVRRIVNEVVIPLATAGSVATPSHPKGRR